MNNPFSNLHRQKQTHPNDKRTDRERQAGGLWESYKTLAILESNIVINNALQSPDAQAANKLELARLRRLFWKVEDALIIDPARPAEMPADV